MKQPETPELRAFRATLAAEYARRFPLSQAHYERHAGFELDDNSHGIRWNDPFQPVTARAAGAWIEDLDGHRAVDYWQGHWANLLGHNPAVVTEALAEALADGRGLQSGMVHQVEAEVAELICRTTGSDTVRLTTSGSLGTFYATLLARAFSGRDVVLKAAGGWHGSQPFGLKGVSAQGDSFDHLESEGLSASARAEIQLTRYNDLDDLRRVFAERGDRLACLLVEPVMGAGGGIPASLEYLREARALTEKHGALLLCDEIITGYRFRAGDLTSCYGVRPDLLILGKILGGGMPVAAVAGRRDVLALCSRASGRVKFEGGTYSSHELSLIAARALLRHCVEREASLYPRIAKLGRRAREGLQQAALENGVPVCLVGTPVEIEPESSLVTLHMMEDDGPVPTSPEELARRAHPRIGERLLKSLLLLQDVSVRSGLGAVSAAHSEEDVDRTIEAFRRVFHRLVSAGLV